MTTKPDKKSEQRATLGNKPMARIVIVDDHPLVRDALAKLIEDEGDLEICGQASNVSEALEIVERHDPDLAIVDISLDSSNGLDLIKRLTARNEKFKILVWSMHDEDLFAERSLRAGAKGYINKKEATEMVIEAIRQILHGKLYLSSRMADRMLGRLVTGDHEVDSSPISALSDREVEVFELIGQGLTTRQIADKLHLSAKTIESHRDAIKRKLLLDNNNELIRRAVQWELERQ